MKKIVIRTFVVLMAMFLYGCPDGGGPYQMYTKIRSDGSCYREFIRSADSAFVAGDTSRNPFPMKIDSTWKITYYKRMAGDTSRYANLPPNITYKKDSTEFTWFATAKKEYASVEDLAKSFRFDDSKWDSIVPDIALRKKFRWFYTYFEFSETYKPVNPFKRVPITDYLSDKEIAALYGEDQELYKGKNGYEIKSLLEDLENKADKWFNHSFYEELYAIYILHFDLFKGAPIDADRFAMEKDTIYKYYFKEDTVDMFEKDFDEMLDHHFHTKAFTSASTDEFEETMKNEFPDFMKYSEVELNYRMSLPGKIIETNAPFMNQDTLTWKVEENRFYFHDYPLTATSRKPNYWAFVVTGIVVILALVGLMVRRV
jgi:hypothetical protein